MRQFLYGSLAILIASGTAMGAWKVMSGYDAALQEALRPAETVEVVRMLHPLAEGQVISKEDVALIRVPENLVDKETAVLKLEDAVGKTVYMPLLTGELLRKERLDLGAAIRMENLIKKGMRAVSVRVDRAAGIGGLLSPGDYVDLLVIERPGILRGLGPERQAQTLLQAVQVLAVGDELVNGVTKKTDVKLGNTKEVYVTLAVRPEDVSKVALAVAQADIYLSLRAENDHSLFAVEAPAIKPVHTDAPTAAAAPKAAPKVTVSTRLYPPAEVIQGSNVQHVEHP